MEPDMEPTYDIIDIAWPAWDTSRSEVFSRWSIRIFWARLYYENDSYVLTKLNINLKDTRIKVDCVEALSLNSFETINILEYVSSVLWDMVW